MEKLGYMEGGFVRIFTELERRILARGGKILTSTPVRKIRLDGNGRVRGLDTAAGSLDFDAVVWTAPVPHLLDAAPELPGELKARFESISYMAVLCFVLVLKNPVSDFYWMNIGDSSLPFGAVIEHTNFVPRAFYDGLTLLYVSSYIRRDHPDFQSASPDAVLEKFFPYLERMFPNFRRSSVEEALLFRDPFATPVYGKNYLAHLPPAEMPVRGLFLANTARIYPFDRNMSNSVRVSDEAVDCIRARLETGAP